MYDYNCELYINDDEYVNPEVIVTAGENGCFISIGPKEEILDENHLDLLINPMIDAVITFVSVLLAVYLINKISNKISKK